MFDKRFSNYKRQFAKSNQALLHKLAMEKSPNVWDQIKILNCPPKRPSFRGSERRWDYYSGYKGSLRQVVPRYLKIICWN